MKRYIGIIPVFFIFLANLALWIWPDIGMLILLLFFYVSAAMLVWSCVVIFRTIYRREFRNGLPGKLILWLAAVNLALFISFFYIRVPMYRCDEYKMEAKYESINNELENLSSYLRDHLNDGKNIDLEFNWRGVDMRFAADSSGYRRWIHYDDKMNTHELDSLSRLVGLDNEALRQIRKALKEIGCISVSTNFPEYCEFGYRRVGMAKYSFILLTEYASRETLNEFIEDPRFIPYDDKCLFLFSGGAIGSQAWDRETKREYMESRHRPGT